MPIPSLHLLFLKTLFLFMFLPEYVSNSFLTILLYLFHTGNENFQISPIDLFGDSKELIVRRGEELFILSTNKNDFYTSESSDYQLPSQLSHLLTLDFEKIINKEFSINDIANNVGGKVEGNIGNDRFIDITNTMNFVIKYPIFV